MTMFVVVTNDDASRNERVTEVDVLEAQDMRAVERYLMKRHRGELLDGEEEPENYETWEKVREYIAENCQLYVSIYEVEKKVVL